MAFFKNCFELYQIFKKNTNFLIFKMYANLDISIKSFHN